MSQISCYISGVTTVYNPENRVSKTKRLSLGFAQTVQYSGVSEEGHSIEMI